MIIANPIIQWEQNRELFFLARHSAVAVPLLAHPELPLSTMCVPAVVVTSEAANLGPLSLWDFPIVSAHTATLPQNLVAMVFGILTAVVACPAIVGTTEAIRHGQSDNNRKLILAFNGT